MAATIPTPRQHDLDTDESGAVCCGVCNGYADMGELDQECPGRWVYRRTSVGMLPTPRPAKAWAAFCPITGEELARYGTPFLAERMGQRVQRDRGRTSRVVVREVEAL